MVTSINMVKNYKLKIFIVCLIFLSFFIGRFTVTEVRVSNNSETTSKAQTNETVPAYLGTGQMFEKYFVHIDKDTILFTSFEGMGNYIGGEIKKTDYPKLFEAYSDGTNFIKVDELKDKKHNKTFSLVTNNVFSHGAYVETYGLIFDPEVGSVVYESPDILSQSSIANLSYSEINSEVRMETFPYYFFSSCVACKLSVIDFQAYDPSSKKFISANNRHKDDFAKLLSEYEDIAVKKCEIGGKVVNVNDLLKTQSPDTKCDDSNLPGKEDANKDFYTIGQFDELRQKVKSIVEGSGSTLIN